MKAMSKEKDENGVILILEDDSDLPWGTPKSGWRDLRGNLTSDPGYQEKLKLTPEQIELRKRLKNDKTSRIETSTQSPQVSPSIRTDGKEQSPAQGAGQKAKRHRRRKKKNGGTVK